MSSTRRRLGPVALCAVLGVALLVGSGALDAQHAGASARIAALERDVRCPGSECGDLSVAQSEAPSSIALRNEIAADVRGGQSDRDILATIVARYGTGILLSPPAGGLDTLLGRTGRARRGSRGLARRPRGAATAMTADADQLRDELTLLLASIADARTEHQAGDLDDTSLAAIVERDGARIAEVRGRLARLGAASPAVPDAPRPAARRRRGRLLAVAATSLVVAVVVAVLAATDPFATAPPAPRVTRADQVLGLLDAGEKAVAQGDQLQALTAYDAALRLAPHDAEALIESGWLRYEQGLALHREAWVRAGAATLRHAVVVAPTDAAAHLYDGIVLYQYDRDHGAALHQIVRAGDLPESQLEQSVTATFLAILEPRANERN